MHPTVQLASYYQRFHRNMPALVQSQSLSQKVTISAIKRFTVTVSSPIGPISTKFGILRNAGSAKMYVSPILFEMAPEYQISMVTGENLRGRQIL